MMKKIVILSLIALSTVAANAQTSAKDSIAALKLAAKVEKAQKAADLKAFKEKQKADLAAFIEKQKGGSAATTATTAAAPVLSSQNDSIAHIYGTALSRGLKQYAAMQLGVDTTKMEEFTQGILENISVDNSTPEKKAYNVGKTIGADIANKTEAFAKEYFAADPGQTFDTKVVGSAITDALLGKSDIKPEDAGQQLQTIMQKRQAENNEKLYGPNREAGEKFLAENKTKEGVVTLPDGLQYKVITMGTGAKPQKTDKVKVNYEGKLIDGTVFDSSYKRNKPATFGCGQVIKGWTEALQLMPVGSKWELYIPQELAYGERASGKDIKPYSALTFTVELLEINPVEENAKTTAAKTATNAKTAAKTTAKTATKTAAKTSAKK